MLLDSLNGQRGDQVTLLSPKRNFVEHSSLTFSYHMLLNANDTDGALTVYRFTELFAYDTVLFTAHGNQGEEWMEAEACIPPGMYQLAFVGTVGLASLSDIAIDNIEVAEDKETCSGVHSSSSQGAAFLICTTLHRVRKKVTIYSSLTLPNDDRFSKFFTDKFSSKFLAKRKQRMSPDLKRVPTLGYEILMSQKSTT